MQKSLPVPASPQTPSGVKLLRGRGGGRGSWENDLSTPFPLYGQTSGLCSCLWVSVWMLGASLECLPLTRLLVCVGEGWHCFPVQDHVWEFRVFTAILGKPGWLWL